MTVSTLPSRDGIAALLVGQARAGLAVERVAQGGPRSNPELEKGPIEMRADRPGGEIELLADLPVGHPRGGHLGDLQLLRRELVPGRGHPTAARLAGGAELLARELGQ